MKFEIIKFKSVTSTNDTAINMIRKKKKLSGCIYADLQSKGRGTHGKEWISENGNLFISLFFPLEKKYPSFTEFSIITPVIITDVIKKFCYGEKINLKFPNDVFLNKKKVCGILQEIITQDDKKFLIIGIGLNVISNPDLKNFYKTTNILLETKKKINIDEVINQILNSYKRFFTNLNSYNYENFKTKAQQMVLN